METQERFDGWPHVMQSQQFPREWLEGVFFPRANEMQKVFEHGGSEILRGKKMISLFYQPSTRTRISFEMAMSYLGGVVLSTENAREFSSAKKGETLGDTLRVLNQYRPDVIVIRYDGEVPPEFVAEVSRTPVINAGDREPGQHPTQALLDLLTISKHRGTIDGLKIAMVGDLMFGRTVRSLCYLLSKFKNVEIDFVSPGGLRMKFDVKDYLKQHGVAYRELFDLREVASNVDVIYQTRIQKECGAEVNKFDRELGYFVVDQKILGLMKKDAIIMHPLPRVDEINTDVDLDPRAVYLTKQIQSGLFTRMALLEMILAPNGI